MTSLWEVFDKQKALPFAGRMARLLEDIAGPKKELLAAYRKRIEAVPGWAGTVLLSVQQYRTGDRAMHVYDEPANRLLDQLPSVDVHLHHIVTLTPAVSSWPRS